MSNLDDIFAEFTDKKKEEKKAPPPKEEPEEEVKEDPPKEEKEERPKPKKKKKKTEPEPKIEDKSEKKEKPKPKKEAKPKTKKEEKTKSDPEPEPETEKEELDDSYFDQFGPKKGTKDASKKEIDDEFDLSPEAVSQQRTYMIYGLKGNGKTDLALSFEGKIAAISFDRKTTQIKELKYSGDRITVFDGIRYLDLTTTDHWMESAEKSFRYLCALLEGPIQKMRPDWIAIDGTEIFIRDICEMNMRWQENLKAFEGFANRNLWKERNMFANQVHLLSLKLAKKGVIYTAYVNDKVQKIIGGNIVEQKYEPKWAGNIKTQVGTVIFVESEQTEDGKIFWAIVESSKTPEMRTGLKIDITDTGVKAIIEASKK